MAAATLTSPTATSEKGDSLVRTLSRGRITFSKADPIDWYCLQTCVSPSFPTRRTSLDLSALLWSKLVQRPRPASIPFHDDPGDHLASHDYQPSLP